MDDGRKTRLPLPRSGVLGIVAALDRLCGVVEFLFRVLGPLRIGCARRSQKPGQIPARRRLRQPFVLEIEIFRPGSDQVEAERLHKVVADVGALLHRRNCRQCHDALRGLTILPAAKPGRPCKLVNIGHLSPSKSATRPPGCLVDPGAKVVRPGKQGFSRFPSIGLEAVAGFGWG